MKLRFLLLAGCAACVAALTSCDGTESVGAGALFQVSVDAGSDREVERGDGSKPEWAGVRARADAAYAEIKVGGQRTRFESRIGPQPWPEGLPAAWPRPSQARVVADMTRQRADRLLLVDLPDSPDQALESYRNELRAVGYHVVRPASRQSTHALHVKRGNDEAVLTFFRREHATRLEIFFVGGVAD